MVKTKRKICQDRKGAIVFLGLLVVMVWALAFWSFSGGDICLAGEDRGAIDFGNGGPGRYSIFDRNFELAATSFNLAVVYVMPPELADIKMAASRLASIMAMDEQEILGKIRNENNYVRLPGYLTTAAANRIRAMGMNGVYLTGEPRRFYPHGPLASHLLGFTREGRGLSGVEALFDRELRRGGISTSDENETRGNVVLTIDLDLQRRLENGLTRIRQDSGGGGAMAGVIEVNSGDILALACVPAFDPNHFWDYETARVVNSFIDSRRGWPGLAASLSAANVGEAGGGFARIAAIPGFAGGGYGPAGDRLRSGFTPIETMVALARMVNSGREMMPHLKKIMWREDRGFFSPFSWHDPVPVVTAKESRDFLAAMRPAVENDMVFIDADPVSGSALAAFYPAANPRFVILAVVDSPPDDVSCRSGLREMGRDILRRAATVKSAIQPPDRRRLAMAREKAGGVWRASLGAATGSPPAVKREAVAAMPDLIGMSARRALRLVQPLGVRVRLIGSGRVKTQTPAPGRRVRDDDLLTLELEALT